MTFTEWLNANYTTATLAMKLDITTARAVDLMRGEAKTILLEHLERLNYRPDFTDKLGIGLVHITRLPRIERGNYGHIELGYPIKMAYKRNRVQIFLIQREPPDLKRFFADLIEDCRNPEAKLKSDRERSIRSIHKMKTLLKEDYEDFIKQQDV